MLDCLQGYEVPTNQGSETNTLPQQDPLGLLTFSLISAKLEVAPRERKEGALRDGWGYLIISGWLPLMYRRPLFFIQIKIYRFNRVNFRIYWWVKKLFYGKFHRQYPFGIFHWGIQYATVFQTVIVFMRINLKSPRLYWTNKQPVDVRCRLPNIVSALPSPWLLPVFQSPQPLEFWLSQNCCPTAFFS